VIIKDKNKRFLKNGFSSEWDSYKSNLHSNKDRINFYIERNEIDQTNDRTNNLYWEGKISSFEKYKLNLPTNEQRIYWYTKVKEIDDCYDPTLRLYKPEFNNLEHKHMVIDCLKKYEFNRGLLLTLHVPSYLTFGKYSEQTQRITERNPEDYFYQIEQILKRFNRRLERRVFKVKKGNTKTQYKRTQNDTRRLEKFSVIEGCYFRGVRNHIHMIIETPEHLTQKEFILMIKKSHGSYVKSENTTSFLRNQKGIKYNHSLKEKQFELGTIHFKQLDHFRSYQSRLRLFTYLTKEMESNRNTVSFGNVHYKPQHLITTTKVWEDLESINPKEKDRVKQKKKSSKTFMSKQLRNQNTDLEIFMDERLMRRFNKSHRLFSEKLSSIKV